MTVSPRWHSLHPQAAAELAQEMALVAQALFVQLLPDTATRAVAGIPLPGDAEVATASSGAAAPPTVPVVPATVPAPDPAPHAAVSIALTPAVAPPVGVPVPTVVPMPPDPPGEPQRSVAMPPVPAVMAVSVPVPQLDAPAQNGEQPEPLGAQKVDHSMVMLDEIRFLDE